MSRVSLSKRLMAIRDAALPPGSLQHRLYHLQPWERQRYSDWQDEMAIFYAALIAKDGPSAPYERFLEAQDQRRVRAWEPPVLWPLALRRRMFPEAPQTGDLAERWHEMVKSEARERTG